MGKKEIWKELTEQPHGRNSKTLDLLDPKRKIADKSEPILTKKQAIKIVKELKKKDPYITKEYYKCLEGKTKFDIARQIAFEYGWNNAFQEFKDILINHFKIKEYDLSVPKSFWVYRWE